MRFGIVAAKDIIRAQELAKKIKKYLEVKGHQIAGEKLESADVVLTLGGDGTLIHTACENAPLGVPFIGINAGTLGFLTAAEADEWRETVDKIVKGDYVISERMTLEASLVTSHQSLETRSNKSLKTKDLRLKTIYRAVNEIVVKGMYRVVNLGILVNGQQFLRITGDGVIVATPTGSTAYSLSAGGPIVDPEVDCLLVTPINAVGLPIPSVVLSADDVIEIKVVSGNDVSLVVDGQEHTKVTKEQSVKVIKGRYRVKFGYFDKHRFLKALNAKFGLALRQAQGKRVG